MICTNCSHNCNIELGSVGLCHSRRNVDGKIISDTYGKVTSLALDPIEKKPLVTFCPGSMILSIGTYGCNLRCPWCQNDSISRGEADYRVMSPELIAALAEEMKNTKGNIGVAYTYNEPLTSYEYVYDCARCVHEAGMKNVLVSNGMCDEKRFSELMEYIDAFNIDLKTADAAKYRAIGGDYEEILANIKAVAEYNKKAEKCLELTTLIVPGFNDTAGDMENIAKVIADIDENIVLHITRFYPAGNMRDTAPTDIDIMYRNKDIAEKYLKRVYLGNMPG